MAKTTVKPVVKKSTGRPTQKSTVRHAGQQSVATPQKSTTNIGTRPPTAIYAPVKAPSVMPGQPGVPTGAPAKVAAAPIVKTPAPAINQAAVLASNIAKAAAAQQQHNAVARTALNHPAEVASGPSGGNTGGGGYRGGYSSGGVGSGATAITPSAQVTTPTAPVVSAPAPAITSPTTPGAPSNVGSFTSTGGQGTFGQFNRQRLNRGPRTGMSVTPEMLQRIAAQRIGPT